MTSYSTAVARSTRRARPFATDNDGVISNGHSGRLAVLSSTKSSTVSHARQHSANSAGDVFGAFGNLQSHHNLNGVIGTADCGRTTAMAGFAKAIPGHGETQRSKLATRNVDTSIQQAELASSTSSSSAPSTPACSLRQQPKPTDTDYTSCSSKQKFEAFYSKPRLLSMWSEDLTADVPMKDMYALCENPDAQTYSVGGQDVSGSLTQQRPRYGAHEAEYGDRTVTKRNLNNSLSGTVGSKLSLGQHRRIAAGERFSGLQGGVLPSVATASRLDADEQEDVGPTDVIAVGVSRSSRLTLNGKIVERPLVPASAAWTSNRWRHLRDEDSGSASGSSPKEDTELEEETLHLIMPMQDTVREANDMSGVSKGLRDVHIPDANPARPSRSPIERSDPHYARLLINTHEVPHTTQSTLARHSSRTEATAAGSPATGALASAVACRALPAVVGTGLVSDEVRFKLGINTQLAPLRTVSMRSPEANLAGGPIAPSAAPQASTPSRRETVEGLEILARRSPIQEKSMATLQGQLPLLPSHAARSPEPRRETLMWQYRDPYGVLQGPFAAAQMQEWHRQRFFQETLMVKRVEWLDFVTLGNLIMRTDDVHTPFLTAKTSSSLPPGIPEAVPAPMRSPYVQQEVAGWTPPSAAASRSHSVAQLFNNPAIGSVPPTSDGFAGQQSATIDLATTDPWADTLPSRVSSPSISRVNSTHGVGAIGRSVGSSSRLTEPPLPSPIGRSSSSKALDRVAVLQEYQQDLHNAQVVSSSPRDQSLGSVHSEANADQKLPPSTLLHSVDHALPAISSPVDVRTDRPHSETPLGHNHANQPEQPILQVNTYTKQGPMPQTDTQSTAAVLRDSAASAGRSLPVKNAQTNNSRSTSAPSQQVPTSKAPDSLCHIEPEITKAAPWAKGAAEPNLTVSRATTDSVTITGLSLRDIQAKEEKEATIRKLAEKRAAHARIASEEAAAAEKLARQALDRLPSSSTWAEASPVVPTPAVIKWGRPLPNPSSGSTRTALSLKEIQEEEARKAKSASPQFSGHAVSSGKAYATSAARIVQSSPSQAAGPWTTVGVPKAASAVFATTPVPPVKTTLTSKPLPPARSNGTIQSTLAVPKASPGTLPASIDLLRWCKDALKGLDVSVDEFVTMLLSFPVPIDKGTRELIADSVYSSSRTLDGRHFAEAFADKRTSDLRAIKAGKVAIAPAPAQKSKSMADAIKFVPALQPLSDFKIVKPKGKGKK